MPAIEEAQKVIREKCERNGGEGAYDNLEVLNHLHQIEPCNLYKLPIQYYLFPVQICFEGNMISCYLKHYNFLNL